MRGITISAFMPLSNDPPVMAVSVTADGDFASTLPEAGLVGLSILESGHEFVAERFAGRAPLPDRSFSGIAHRIEAGAPIIIGALAWCVGSIGGNELVGDHRLVRVTVRAAGSGEDTDDPLVTYEGRYRRLEAG
jgi:flavin reductase (DIM6/NTAB) family NADH-FMN oxidoreductase RutF